MFQGTWELDPSQSDTLEGLAAALGFSSSLVKLAPTKPVQAFSVDGSALIISGKGLFGQRTERFAVDGKTPTKMDLLGSACEVVTRWNGPVLESTGTIEINGKRQPIKLERSLEHGQMRLIIRLGEVSAGRVFKRLAP